jgi:hypothetical protein
MIQNITKISERIFDYFLSQNKKIRSPKNLYLIYFNLNKVIEDSKLVANHYLTLRFDEDFLQNSSFGTPQDKWRFFLNKDLDYLNNTAKKYLLMLTGLSFDNDTLQETFIYDFYNCKGYYDFVKHRYDIGSIPPSSLYLLQNVLNTDFKDKSTYYYIEKRNKIDLSSYENRVKLKEEILKEVKKLEDLRDKTSKYLRKKFTIDDLLFKGKI